MSAATKLEQLTREHEEAAVLLGNLRRDFDLLSATALIEGKPTPTSPKELAKCDDRVRALHAAIVRLRGEVDAEVAADRERQLAVVHERIARLLGERQAMSSPIRYGDNGFATIWPRRNGSCRRGRRRLGCGGWSGSLIDPGPGGPRPTLADWLGSRCFGKVAFVCALVCNGVFGRFNVTDRKRKTLGFIRGFRLATWVGLEPMTSAVTGRRSNQLSYQANCAAKSAWWAMQDSNLRQPACKAGALAG